MGGPKDGQVIDVPVGAEFLIYAEPVNGPLVRHVYHREKWADSSGKKWSIMQWTDPESGHWEAHEEMPTPTNNVWGGSIYYSPTPKVSYTFVPKIGYPVSAEINFSGVSQETFDILRGHKAVPPADPDNDGGKMF